MHFWISTCFYSISRFIHGRNKQNETKQIKIGEIFIEYWYECSQKNWIMYVRKSENERKSIQNENEKKNETQQICSLVYSRRIKSLPFIYLAKGLWVRVFSFLYLISFREFLLFLIFSIIFEYCSDSDCFIYSWAFRAHFIWNYTKCCNLNGKQQTNKNERVQKFKMAATLRAEYRVHEWSIYFAYFLFIFLVSLLV